MFGLNGRQSAGVGLLIAGLLAFVEGFVKVGLPADPAWLSPVLQIVGFAAQAVGLVVNLPNTRS